MMQSISVSAAALTLCLGLGAQATSLLSRFDPPGVSYNDVWGYAAPGGGEYALLGTTSGTFVIDCSDPTNPVQRAFFSGPGSPWRDIRTFGHYAYVVTEGGPGVQIIDLADPDNPVLLGTWGTQFISKAHNVAIDTDAGILYACGAGAGVVMVDLNQNPTSPSFLGSYNIAYVHDLHVQDGYAHLGEINNSRYRILDVSAAPAFNLLGAVQVSSCHNAWPSRDNNLAVATSERSGGRLTVIDITDKSSPRTLATWGTGGGATSIHNAYIRDRVVHAAYYSEGYQTIDLSDQTKPRGVGAYDTSSSTGGFSGAWGCYPFQPSGVIYISDMSNGLHVIASKTTTCQYGVGLPGVAGMPSIHTTGCAFSGNANFGFEVDDAAPNAPATLVLSAGSQSTVIGGLSLNVDFAQPHLLVTGTTDASGHAQLGMPLPFGLPEIQLYAQILVVDPSGPLSLSSTQGLKVDFFRRSADV